MSEINEAIDEINRVNYQADRRKAPNALRNALRLRLRNKAFAYMDSVVKLKQERKKLKKIGSKDSKMLVKLIDLHLGIVQRTIKRYYSIIHI